MNPGTITCSHYSFQHWRTLLQPVPAIGSNTARTLWQPVHTSDSSTKKHCDNLFLLLVPALKNVVTIVVTYSYYWFQHWHVLWPPVPSNGSTTEERCDHLFLLLVKPLKNAMTTCSFYWLNHRRTMWQPVHTVKPKPAKIRKQHWFSSQASQW